jgi:hypothetical protein
VSLMKNLRDKAGDLVEQAKDQYNSSAGMQKAGQQASQTAGQVAGKLKDATGKAASSDTADRIRDLTGKATAAVKDRAHRPDDNK